MYRRSYSYPVRTAEATRGRRSGSAATRPALGGVSSSGRPPLLSSPASRSVAGWRPASSGAMRRSSPAGIGRPGRARRVHCRSCAGTGTGGFDEPPARTADRRQLGSPLLGPKPWRTALRVLPIVTIESLKPHPQLFVGAARVGTAASHPPPPCASPLPKANWAYRRRRPRPGSCDHRVTVNNITFYLLL